MKKSFQVWQIVVAIISVCIFPLGLVVLLVPRKWKCTVCGKWLGKDYSNEKSNYVPLKINPSYNSPINPIIKQKLTVDKIKDNETFKKFQQTTIYKFFAKNKLWIILSAVVLCIVLVFVTSSVRKFNYIKDEFAYAEQAQASENYFEALNHIDNILRKDNDNKNAMEKKTELEKLQKEHNFTNNIRQAQKYKDEGDYINAYNYVTSALDLKPDNEEALKFKDELLPLYQEQKKQREEEEAKKKAEEEAKKAQQEAEAKAKQEAEAKAKQEAEAKAAEEKRAQEEAAAKTQADLDAVNAELEARKQANNKLDKTFYGSDYTISYPSTYETTDMLADFMTFEPDSGSNVSVMRLDGRIQDMSQQSLREELGESFNIQYINEGKTSNGYKYYNVVSTTYDGLKCRQYITGRDNYLYYVTAVMGYGITNENTDIINAMVDSFKLSN